MWHIASESCVSVTMIQRISFSHNFLTVSSALKDVSAVCEGTDGAVLEQLVESAIKVNKLLNSVVVGKMQQLESDALEDTLACYYKEASIGHYEAPRMSVALLPTPGR